MDQPKTFEHVGQVVRFLRTQRGWTQGELSEKLGVPAPYISMVETGVERYQNMRLGTVDRFAEVFGLSASNFIAMLDIRNREVQV